MGWNPLKTVKQLWKGGVKVTQEGIDVAVAIATGTDLEEIVKEAAEAHQAAAELQPVVVDVTVMSLAAMIAYEMSVLIAAIEAGRVVIPGVATAINLYGKLEDALKPIKAKYDAAEARIRGNVAFEVLNTAVRTARTVHAFGMTFSAEYRRRVEAIYRETAAVSRQVFGDSVAMHSALNLLRMVNADATRLGGEEVDIGEAEWFMQSVEVLEMVEKKSSEYARQPEVFWYDFNTEFITPLLHTAASEQRASDARTDAINLTLGATVEHLDAFDARFVAYRKELDPFLSAENRRALDKMREDWVSEVITPISEFNNFIQDEFPIVTEQMIAEQKRLDEAARLIEENALLLADPATLDEDEQRAQSDRVLSIFDNAFVTGSGAPSDVQAAMADTRALFDRLESLP